jgi:hypothetical protein
MKSGTILIQCIGGVKPDDVTNNIIMIPPTALYLENFEGFTWELNHHTLKISVLNFWLLSGTTLPPVSMKTSNNWENHR